MERHQGNPFLLQVGLINIGKQRHLAQKILQIWFFFLLLLKIPGNAYKFMQVLNAGLILDFLLRLVIFQGFLIAGLLHDLLNQVGHRQLVHALHQLQQQQGKLLQRVAASGCKARHGSQQFLIGYYLKQAHIIFHRINHQLVHGSGADTPLRHVDDAHQADSIHRIEHNPEIGHNILDFHAVIEFQPPYHGIRQSYTHKGIFQHPGLGIGAVQNRHITIRRLVNIMLLADSIRDEPGLIPLIRSKIGGNLVPLGIIRPQAFLLAMRVVVNYRIGSRQDILGGAIILLQHDGTGIRIVLLKVQDIGNIRTAPAVDGLIRITHHAEITVAPCQQGSQLILCPVGILILIHQNVLEAPLIAAADFLIFRQQRHRHQQQIIKVKGIVLPEHCLIFLVYLGNLFLKKITCLRLKCQRPQHLVLGIGNSIAYSSRIVLLIVQIQFLDDLLDHRLSITGIIDDKIALVHASGLNLPAQKTGAEGMKGTEPDFLGIRSNHVLHTLPHLSCRLVGKGDGQNTVGGNAMLQQVGNPVGKHPCLA